MAVYVDPLMNHGTSKTWKWTHSCHMFADSVEELNKFAVAMGLKLAWFQLSRSGRFPHYDLTAKRRVVAVRKGAIELDRHGMVSKLDELGYLRRSTKSEVQ